MDSTRVLIQQGTAIGIKLADKTAALKLVGEHLGMWNDKAPAIVQQHLQLTEGYTLDDVRSRIAKLEAESV